MAREITNLKSRLFCLDVTLLIDVNACVMHVPLNILFDKKKHN
jgi:hypothetical protein